VESTHAARSQVRVFIAGAVVLLCVCSANLHTHCNESLVKTTQACLFSAARAKWAVVNQFGGVFGLPFGEFVSILWDRPHTRECNQLETCS